MTTDSDPNQIAYPLAWDYINCPCCGFGVLDVRLHAGLVMLDEILDSHFEVTSLTRCRAHNAQVGGSPNSRHLVGLAADLRPRGITLYRLISAALTTPCFENAGIGLYPDLGIIHVDIRPTPTRWGKIGSKNLGFRETWKATWPTKPMPDRLALGRPSSEPQPPDLP
jgi:hypothetical protein